MDFTLTGVDSVNVTPLKNYMQVEIEGAMEPELLEQIVDELGATKIADHFGTALLDEFDRDTVLAHFDITEAEE